MRASDGTVPTSHNLYVRQYSMRAVAAHQRSGPYQATLRPWMRPEGGLGASARPNPLGGGVGVRGEARVGGPGGCGPAGAEHAFADVAVDVAADVAADVALLAGGEAPWAARARRAGLPAGGALGS